MGPWDGRGTVGIAFDEAEIRVLAWAVRAKILYGEPNRRTKRALDSALPKLTQWLDARELAEEEEDNHAAARST